MCPTQALSRIAVCVNESFSDVFPGPASKGLILHGTEKKKSHHVIQSASGNYSVHYSMV